MEMDRKERINGQKKIHISSIIITQTLNSYHYRQSFGSSSPHIQDNLSLHPISTLKGNTASNDKHSQSIELFDDGERLTAL